VIAFAMSFVRTQGAMLRSRGDRRSTAAVRAASAGTALDWPMSRDEKKSHLMHLYDQDVRAADRMLLSERAALAAVREELTALKRSPAARSFSSAAAAWSEVSDSCESCLQGGPAPAAQGAAEIWQVVERAAAVLRAVLPDREDACVADAPRTAEAPGMVRAQSESALPLKPALSRTPCGSRCDTPKRRVSFSDPVPSCIDTGSDVEEMVAPNPDVGSDPSEPEPEECTSVEDVSDDEKQGFGRLSTGLNELCAPASVQKVGLGIKHLPPEPLEVRRVTPGSWAEAQGIEVGDVLVAVGHRHADELTGPQFVHLMQSRPLHLVVERLRADLSRALTPRDCQF